VIEMLETLSAVREVTLPSIESSRFAPFRRSVIVCAFAPMTVVSHGAGGERPGPGVEAGSGGVVPTLAEDVVAPSDCVAGTWPVVVPPDPPDEVPVPPDVPLTPLDCGASLGCAGLPPEDEVEPVVPETPVPPALEPTTSEPIVPAVPVVPVTFDCVPDAVEAPIVPVFELPTVAVVSGCWTGAGEPTVVDVGDVVSAGSPAENNW